MFYDCKYFYGSFQFGFFNLLPYALFKASSFMCSGGVIRSIGDSQDIRFMGCLSIYMPLLLSV